MPLIFGIFYILVGLLGFEPGTLAEQLAGADPVTVDTLFGLMPLHSNDIWLHGLSALVAGYFGFVAQW